MRTRGSTLIVVLFVMAVLSLAAVSMAYRTGLESRSIKHRVVMAQLRAGALSAVAIAVDRLREDDNEFDHPAEAWHGHRYLENDEWLSEQRDKGSASAHPVIVEYAVVDEESKLHVLHASSESLKKIGMTPEQVASMLDWMDEDDVERSEGAENEHYLAKPYPYRCKNAPVETLDELLLIRGFGISAFVGEEPADARYLAPLQDDGPSSLSSSADAPDDEQLQLGWEALLTAAGDGRINLNTAQRAVLRTLPLSEGAVGQIEGFRAFDEDSSGELEDHAFRSAEDIERLQGLTSQDKEVLKLAGGFKSTHFRILVRARHKPSGLTYELRALVRKNGQAIDILQWKTGRPVWDYQKSK